MISSASRPTGPSLFQRASGQLDWLLIAVTLILSGIGILMIFSAIQTQPDLLHSNLHWKQLIWTSMGAALVVAVLLFDYRSIVRMGYLIYAVTLILLVLVLFSGRTVSGSQRWLVLGPLRIQPSELARIGIILLFARYFGTRESNEPLRFKEILLPSVLFFLPAVLVAKQPDLGTSVMIVLIGVGMMLAVGIRWRILFSLGLLGVATAPLGWLLLKTYQRKRILTVLNPDLDPLGAGYQSLQSKIAVGSGEIWGKGLFQGTQSRLHFLPEKHTDFIFSVLSEELGFLGGMILLLLFLILVHRCIAASLMAADKQGALLAVGVATTFTLYIVINIGMTLGLTPIVGIPLPLVSYGGSALLTSFLGVALVLNVRMRRRGFAPYSQTVVLFSAAIRREGSSPAAERKIRTPGSRRRPLRLHNLADSIRIFNILARSTAPGPRR